LERPVKLIVISPESEYAHEQAVLVELFTAGLTSYHLRKPVWTRGQLAAFLREVPPEFHPRIVLHTHHDLAGEFTLGGLHQRDAEIPICHLLSDKLGLIEVVDGKLEKRVCHLLSDKNSGLEGGGIASRAVHDLETLRASLFGYDRLLLSPIFPSFSKVGYGPLKKLPDTDLRAVLALPRRAAVIALGGIDASRIQTCRELGFDGVAVLGAIWQAPDPVRAFAELQNALHAHAA
jgi:thiamine-phosphate pyrophosphorylase